MGLVGYSYSMKKLFLILILFAVSCKVNCSVISTCVYYDGYWGKWSKVNIGIIGNYSTMTLYNEQYHPSLYNFKFTITNYRIPTKEEQKQHIASNRWIEYEGFVEYYIIDEYMTIKEIFKKFNWPSICPALHKVEEGQTPCVKRTVKAIIRIQPYKDHPKRYNIVFEDVMFGIDLEDNFFK